ncbi:hypothetical protein FBEOM_3259 [Fusarium beomiforme]|uniref:Uncharacterized protein n=1 Tax=Fusarium beomiforme TaxID=44412 RepID=A0A9P5AQD4_9HYPO|nr:hypothetical protein FBEOM_3259 [Fusarium beomiforme]
MDSNHLGSNTGPPGYTDNELTDTTPQLSMCNCPRCDAMATNWTPCAFLYPSPLVSPVLHLSFPPAYPCDQTVSTVPAAGRELCQSTIINSPASSSFHGEWPNSFAGLHQVAGNEPFNLPQVSETQKLHENPRQQASSQKLQFLAPWSTTEHFPTKDTKALSNETKLLDCLAPEDRFIVECKLKGMKWKFVPAEYERYWKRKGLSTLRKKLTKVNKKYPDLKQILIDRKRRRALSG